MKVTQSGANTRVELSGPIGESTGLFKLKLEGVKDLVLDMTKSTFINSVGVKYWIVWTLRIPKDCQVHLLKAPFVIASQASTVMGFMSKNMRIESMVVPYTCESCNVEKDHIVNRGTDYEYASTGKPHVLNLPKELTCTHCKTGKLEPDFLIEKTFKFLETR